MSDHVRFQPIDAEDARIAPAFGDLELARRFLSEAELVGDEQRRTRDRVQEFCDAHTDALDRACVKGHLTGSAVVVDQVKGEALVIHHAKLDRWLQPGGHADGDGNLGHVAWREATEETGIAGLRLVVPAIHIDIHEFPERGSEPAHLHFDLRFLVLAPPGAAVMPNHESIDVRWVTERSTEVGRVDGELAGLIARGLQVSRLL